MNIKQAKEQIKQAVEAYRQKNEFGEYLIPVERQRPIFLMGLPGIGKTAIMGQIAQEMGIGLVSCSMTHLTRQSVLGLPFIAHKTYRGAEYKVSECAMSEIIASVYEQIEQYGLQEGILFLDEINCVSDNLEPAMLQFLQYKTFGQYRVPDGWIVVTAGNQPEQNNTVREFDISTWDRLKRIDVEPDFEVWKEYAIAHDVHPAVLSYPEIRRNDFYMIGTAAEGKSFVTARGWADLSDMIRLYERLDYPVNEQLIRQYLQNAKTAEIFGDYYDLFMKYRSDFQTDAILAGQETWQAGTKAQNARPEERLGLLRLLLDAVCGDMREVIAQQDMLKSLTDTLLGIRSDITGGTVANASKLLDKTAAKLEKDTRDRRKAGILPDAEAAAAMGAAKTISRLRREILEKNPKTGDGAFGIIRDAFDGGNTELKAAAEKTRAKLENMFRFCEKVFPEGREVQLLVSELDLRPYAARFIEEYGCDGYARNAGKVAG